MAGLTLFFLVIAAEVAGPIAPPRARDWPLSAASHIVIMEEQRLDCSNCRTHRRTIIRSGNWLKDERVDADGGEIAYSDFRAGTSFVLSRDRNGTGQRLTVERDYEHRDYLAVSRARTGRTETNLGEICEVWSLVSELSRSESCETSDGIVLWRGSNGRIWQRAISVERRAVRPEEARPPENLFSLVRWPQFDVAAAANEVECEVILRSNSRGQTRTDVFRQQGNLVSGQIEGRRDEGVWFWAGDGHVRYEYQVDEQGRPLHLEVGLRELGWVRSAEHWRQLPDRGPERVLGEECRWQEDVSIRSTDISYICRTEDGVPMMRELHWHWDSTIDLYRAERVTRRPLTQADITPPRAVAQWSTWGVDLTH